MVLLDVILERYAFVGFSIEYGRLDMADEAAIFDVFFRPILLLAKVSKCIEDGSKDHVHQNNPCNKEEGNVEDHSMPLVIRQHDVFPKTSAPIFLPTHKCLCACVCMLDRSGFKIAQTLDHKL